MKKIKLFLICLSAALMCTSTMAQVPNDFAGTWVLKSAEFREVPLNDPQKEIKIAYTLENISEVPFFDAVIEMKFAEITEKDLDSDDETGEEQQPYLPDESEETPEKDYDIAIITAAGQYINPIVQISSIHFEFMDSEGEYANQFEYVFTDDEELLLTSTEVFYTKNEKEPVRARLYIILSQKEEMRNEE